VSRVEAGSPKHEGAAPAGNLAALHRAVDSLQEQFAVLEGNGVIRLVNAAWNRFGAANGARPGPKTGPGASYLDVTQRSARRPSISCGAG
jgi:hypothetical protein